MMVISGTLWSSVFTASGQSPIALEFSEVFLREEFTSKNDDWPYLTTMQNLYVPDKDEYFMHRRDPNTPYAILTNRENNLSEFNILTTLKLGPSKTDQQTIGIILLVQQDGKGAVVFEFNRSKEYRIKQLVGAYYKYLSGTNEDKGWVKTPGIAKNDYNEVDVRVSLPQVDFYVNGKFLQSVDVLEYEPGGMGFIIGPDTKAKSDYFYVYTTPEGKVEAELESRSKEANSTAVEQLADMRYELEQQKRMLRECEMERKKAVTVLEEELARLRQENERLSLSTRQLREFKSNVLVDVEEDVFLTLAENLKTEIIKNQKLEGQVQVYKDSLKLTHDKYSKLKLALLDKAIRKATKEKAEREKREALETKKEIEEELQDEKLQAEQKQWEKENAEVVDTVELRTPTPPTSETETGVQPKPAENEAVRPLPIKVRTARKNEE